MFLIKCCHSTSVLILYFSICSSDIFTEFETEEIDIDSDYDLDLGSYQPIQPISNDHEVQIITGKLAKLSHDYLQVLHHGSTVIHPDEDGSRSVMCFLKLEIDNAILTWQKPSWSSLKSGSSSGGSDFTLKGEGDTCCIQALCVRYTSGEDVYDNMEEGYIDLRIVKNVTVVDEDGFDLTAISKQHNIDSLQNKANIICLLYGSCHSENKKMYFVAPGNVAKYWICGLQKLVKAAHRLTLQTDKRVQLLKNQYLQLYYENEKCQGPTPAEAIKVINSS